MLHLGLSMFSEEPRASRSFSIRIFTGTTCDEPTASPGSSATQNLSLVNERSTLLRLFGGTNSATAANVWSTGWTSSRARWDLIGSAPDSGHWRKRWLGRSRVTVCSGSTWIRRDGFGARELSLWMVDDPSAHKRRCQAISRPRDGELGAHILRLPGAKDSRV